MSAPHLTPREQDVLRCIRRGLLDKQIAHELDISERTVHAHVAHVLRKFKARRRTDLIGPQPAEIKDRRAIVEEIAQVIDRRALALRENYQHAADSFPSVSATWAKSEASVRIRECEHLAVTVRALKHPFDCQDEVGPQGPSEVSHPEEIQPDTSISDIQIKKGDDTA